jgi:hypothetical protein
MACDLCDNLKRSIAAETDSKQKKLMERAFNDHIDQMVIIRTIP